jgi:hypothetical protein
VSRLTAGIGATGYETALHQFCAECYADPLAFVVAMYPWPINGAPGPDTWQAEVLADIGRQVQARGFDGVTPVLPIREAVASGHGIGKSALIAWIVDWIMSTRADCHGTVTANTNDQLDKKTWAAVREWTAKCLTAHWFEINSSIMYRKGHRATWFCAPQSCAEENSEAFAGQHARASTSFYIFDEGSAVPDKIYDVAEGGLTDGEPIIIVTGNPTRSTGRFFEIVFGGLRDRWTARSIDSRTCAFSNKALLQQWVEDYGEDSDFVKVRVRGLPPSASELQYIDQHRVDGAKTRDVYTLPDEPLIAGVDVSGGGGAWTVCRFRRGLDARVRPPIRITGEASRDRNLIINALAEVLSRQQPSERVDAMFIDSAFGAPIVERLKMLGFRHVHEVSFGAKAPDPKKDANFRAYMWRTAKDWLPRGAIPKHDIRLATDLCGPGYHIDKQNRLVIESKASMKDRGVASPDDGDAFVLTFAQPVAAGSVRRMRGGNWQPVEASWTG